MSGLGLMPLRGGSPPSKHWGDPFLARWDQRMLSSAKRFPQPCECAKATCFLCKPIIGKVKRNKT